MAAAYFFIARGARCPPAHLLLGSDRVMAFTLLCGGHHCREKVPEEEEAAAWWLL